MTWREIGENHLSAAKLMVDAHPRSATSRAYYAAHAVLAEALIDAGCTIEPPRQTPPHEQQGGLIRQHLSAKGASFVRELRRVIGRLYKRRLDADYRRTVTVDSATARESVRDASTFFVLLDVR